MGLKHQFGLTQNLFAFPFTAAGVTDVYYETVRMMKLVDVFLEPGTSAARCNTLI